MATLAVIGQRPYTRGVTDNQRNYAFQKAHAGVAYYHDLGYDTLACSLAPGTDQWAATAALIRSMRLNVILPFSGEEQSGSWKPEDRDRYWELLAGAHDVWVGGARPYEHERMLALYQEAYELLVAVADSILIVTNGARKGGTWQCTQLAIEHNVPGILVLTGAERNWSFGNGDELEQLLHEAQSAVA